MVRGRWVQGIALLQRALKQTGPDDSGWYSAHVYLGKFLGRTSDISAVDYLTTVVDALTDGPPSADLVLALVGRSSVLRNTAGLEEAASDANAALALARRMGYATGEALALSELSLIASYADDAEQALEWARQAQQIDRASMPGWRARQIESVLPWMLVESGQLEGTAELLAEILAHARAAGDLHDQADAHFMLAVVARETGRPADAGPHLRETIELAAYSSYRIRLTDAVEEAGYWCAANGRYDAAITLWAARDAQLQALGYTDTPAEEHLREQPMREATQALGVEQARAAGDRGAVTTLRASPATSPTRTAPSGSRPSPSLTTTRATRPPSRPTTASS
jgi:tetratricopeptide (TPR) repeat protein